MAKPNPPHDTMSEAFAKRLHQLYPDVIAYSEGKKVQPAGLKPDIYLQHSDGRQWVFEMVHRNSHAKHLLENHQRYLKAGMNDVWILWEDLEPRSGSKSSLDQGVLLLAHQEPPHYHLGAPQRAILEIQEGKVHFLYAFTPNTLGTELETEVTLLIQTTLLGINVYQFEGWSGQKRYPARCIFIPMHEIEFEQDGSLVVPIPGTDDDILETLMAHLGLAFDEAGMIPSQAAEKIAEMPAVLQRQSAALGQFLLAAEHFSPEDIRDISMFLQTEAFKDLVSRLPSSAAVQVSEAFESPCALQGIALALEAFQQDLRNLGAPQSLLEFVEHWLDPRLLHNAAEWMQWQEESSALRSVREARRGE